jgi:large subunit ribosomal protein L24
MAGNQDQVRNMATKLKVKKGDQVMVITGRDKGKTGEILRVIRDDNRVVVRGVNLAQRHQRQTATEQGGIVSKELSIHVSNVSLIDPKTKKPTRVGYRMDGDRKVRVARRSGEAID